MKLDSAKLDAAVAKVDGYDNRSVPEAKANLEAKVKSASEMLKNFPRGATGLPSDDVRNSAAYRSAKSEYDRAFQALRSYNSRK
jgi:hypothetical protein